MKFGSLNSAYPGYEVSPKYFGTGYGYANSSQVHIKRSYNRVINPSYLDLNPTANPHLWAMHIDKRNLVIKNKAGAVTYNGPAIRIKYYEGSSTYLSNSGDNELLREDYWFIKGVGLVQVDVKNFGNVGRDSIKKYNCSEDPDCMQNEVIQYPHARMVSNVYYY